MMQVTKAVIPAAGLGMRLRPLTRYTPKELLPIGGKPMIQYYIEMCLAAGISEFFIIISPEKAQVRDFVTGEWTPPALPFEKDLRFYNELRQCRIVFAVQNTPKGVADAVGLARAFVGNEPFTCIMPDCILFSETPFAGQLLPTFQKQQKSVAGIVLVTGAEVRRFGNVGVLEAQKLNGESLLITSLSDKTPEPLTADPGETIYKGFGGGIYLPEYFELIDKTRTHAKGEVDDVPIHQELVKEGRLLGVVLQGAAFDAGHLLGLRAANRFAGRSRCRL